MQVDQILVADRNEKISSPVTLKREAVTDRLSIESSQQSQKPNIPLSVTIHPPLDFGSLSHEREAAFIRIMQFMQFPLLIEQFQKHSPLFKLVEDQLSKFDFKKMERLLIENPKLSEIIKKIILKGLEQSFIFSDMTKTLVLQEKDSCVPSVREGLLGLLQKNVKVVIITSDPIENVNRYLLRPLFEGETDHIRPENFYVICGSGTQIYQCLGKNELKLLFDGRGISFSERKLFIEKAESYIRKEYPEFKLNDQDRKFLLYDRQDDYLIKTLSNGVRLKVEVSPNRMCVFLVPNKEHMATFKHIIQSLREDSDIEATIKSNHYARMYEPNYFEILPYSKGQGVQNFFKTVMNSSLERLMKNIIVLGDSYNDKSLFKCFSQHLDFFIDYFGKIISEVESFPFITKLFVGSDETFYKQVMNPKLDPNTLQLKLAATSEDVLSGKSNVEKTGTFFELLNLMSILSFLQEVFEKLNPKSSSIKR